MHKDDINNDSFSYMEEIKFIQNKLDYLKEKNLNLKCNKSIIKDKGKVSRILYLIGMPAIFLSYMGISIVNEPYMLFSEILPGAIIMSGLIIPFNLMFNGTYFKRKKKINKIDGEIYINNIEINNLNDRINKLRKKVNYKENEYVYNKIQPIDRTYEKYQSKTIIKKLTKI